MNNHDIFKQLTTEKELLGKLSPQFSELNDLEEITKHADNPKVLAALMYKVVQERERTNKLLESINDKYDHIMLALKTGHNETTQENAGQQSKFEVLPEQDQLILKTIEERGGCSAKDIKVMLNYKGLNAACQRLNKLYKEGHLKKVQSGRKVLYLAKS